jgi:hypothetical protein
VADVLVEIVLLYDWSSFVFVFLSGRFTEKFTRPHPTHPRRFLCDTALLVVSEEATSLPVSLGL